jgi:hypothetical protein
MGKTVVVNGGNSSIVSEDAVVYPDCKPEPVPPKPEPEKECCCKTYNVTLHFH